MQISHATLQSPVIYALKQGKTLIVDKTQGLHHATWGETVVRWLNWNKAAQQDKDVAEWLIQYLNKAQNSQDYSKTFDAVAKYVKACRRTDEAFKRLENTVFAHKCHIQLPSLQIKELINEDGTPTNPLLNFLKRNNLHYVIPKANAAHKDTAILLQGNQIYFRSNTTEGTHFLRSVDHVKLLLQRLPQNHPDVALLKQLHGDLKAIAIAPNAQLQAQIDQVYHQLEPSHYYYQSLQSISQDQKGVLVSQSYLADGIEDFEHRHWTELKSNFREKTDQPGYKLRVITRLPAYALEKTWIGTLTHVFRNILNFRAHGHSWIELVEPVYDHQGKITEEQNIYNVGYYFHPLNRHKRFESADPMAFMPIPKEYLLCDEVNISEDEFEQAQLYIREVQTLVDNPTRTLNDQPQNDQLSQWEKSDIQYLYKSTMKSTCLTFANVLKEVVTGIEDDHRSGLRRLLGTKRGFRKWDRADSFIEKTYVLQWLIQVPRFALRMELPFWVKHKSPSQSESNPEEMVAN